MANVFIHFEPLGPSDSDMEYGTSDLPPYIIPGSPEEENWRSQNPDGYVIMESGSFVNGTTEAHYAASEGDLDLLTSEIDLYEEHVNARDSNGWTPLHEAVRWGNIDIVQFLIDRGSDVNARVGKSETGGSVLYIAQEHQEGEENHEALIELLESYGAKYIAPLESEDLEYDDDGSEEVNTEL
jgi:prolyl 4-hydroxylase